MTDPMMTKIDSLLADIRRVRAAAEPKIASAERKLTASRLAFARLYGIDPVVLHALNRGR